MGEKLTPKEMATLEELLMSNVLEQEAMVHLLEKKGIIRKVGLLEEIKKLRDSWKKHTEHSEPYTGR